MGEDSRKSQLEWDRFFKSLGKFMKLGLSRGGILWYIITFLIRLKDKKIELIKSYIEYYRMKKKGDLLLKDRQLKTGNVTIVITSCGRKEYLQKTIESLRKHFIYDSEKTSWFIIDDYPESVETREYIEGLLGFDLKIFNPTNRGLGYSLNRIYYEVETEFIFHCEDDWLFLRPIPVRDMINLLKENPHLRQLSLFNALAKPKYKDKVKMTDKGFAETYNKTFTFNPHLSRAELFIQHHPFPLIYSELEYTLKLERAGFGISGIIDYGAESVFVEHLGIKRTGTKY